MSTTVSLSADQFIAEHLDEIRREAMYRLDNVMDGIAFAICRNDTDALSVDLPELERAASMCRVVLGTEPADWHPEVVHYAIDLIRREYAAKLSDQGPTMDEAEAWIGVARRAEALLGAS